MGKTQWIFDVMGGKHVLIHEQKQDSYLKVRVIGWVDLPANTQSGFYEACKIIGGQRVVVGQHKTLQEAQKTVEMGL